MKVYVMTISWIREGEEIKFQPRVFASKKDAVANLEEFSNEEVDWLEARGWEVEEYSEDRFCGYAEGYYWSDHVEATIHECEVM